MKIPKQPFDGIKLPSLVGRAGLDTRTEHELQVACITHYRRALGRNSDVIAIPNQRHMNHQTKKSRGAAIGALVAEGMRIGAHDTLFEWDVEDGEPGNAGMCWIEFKRAVKPEPVKRAQIDFMLWRRRMGKIAGWAQCVEHVEQLLDEAGAPRVFRPILQNDVPPWWEALGSLPPLRKPFL